MPKPPKRHAPPAVPNEVPRTHSRYRLVASLLLVLALKSLVLIQLGSHILLRPVASPDSNAYVALAYRAVSGDWALAPGLYYLSPLYIYFLAIVLAATGSLLVAKAVQIVLGTVAVGLIWLAAKEWFGPRVAWFSAAAATATGLFTFYEVTFLQASLDVFLTSAFLAALALGLSRNSQWWMGAAGVLCGVQTLNRPNVLLTIVVILAGLALLRRWRFAVILVAGLLIGLSPVIARNRLVTGQWSVSTSHGGLNLLIGNADDATGFYRPIPGIRSNMAGQIVDTKRVAEASAGRPLNDSEVSAHFTNLAVTWMKENPAAWLRLMAAKAYYTFHGQHIALPLSYPFFAYDMNTALRFLFVGPWLLLPLGCFGLIACAPRQNRSAYLVWMTFVPAYAGAVAIFFVSERYRLPLLVPLAIGTGATAARLLEHVRASRWPKLARDSAVVLVLAVVMNWPLGWIDMDARLHQRIQMAESLAAEGDYAGAEHWAARGLPGYPYEADARLRLASAFLEGPTPDEARAVGILNGVTANGSDDPGVWLSLGRLAMKLKVAAKSEQFFARAVELAPASAAAREQLGVAQLVSGKYQEAATQLAEVVRLDASNADAWAHLALAYAQLGRPDDALQCANTALARQPGHPMALQVKKAIGRG